MRYQNATPNTAQDQACIDIVRSLVQQYDIAKQVEHADHAHAQALKYALVTADSCLPLGFTLRFSLHSLSKALSGLWSQEGKGPKALGGPPNSQQGM